MMKESAEGMTIEGKVGFVKGERIHLTGKGLGQLSFFSWYHFALSISGMILKCLMEKLV